MKFKHTFSVFLDNFSTNYKLLVYGLIVLAVTAGLSCAILIPLLGSITGTAEYAALELAFSDMWQAVINLETGNLHNLLLGIQDALDSFIAMLGTKTGLFALCAVLLIIVYLINRFLSAIGAYTMGCVVNDKMALRANSSFLYSMTKNLGKASRFSLIYVPVCFVYDFICTAICILVMSVSPMLIKFFSFTVLLILFTAIKNTLICDWLPAVVHGKMPNGKALKFALSRKGKNTAYIFSNLLIIELIVVALNVAAFILTFGAGLLITVPASYLILTCFQFVNYYEGHAMRYFLDENTIIGPERERPLSREEFFRGNDD